MSQPNTITPLAEALTPAKINSYYADLTSQPDTLREASCEGWRLVETGMADPHAKLDITAIENSFNRALTHDPLASEADFVYYTSARMGSATLDLFVARKERRKPDSDERKEARQNIGQFLGELIDLHDHIEHTPATERIPGTIAWLVASYTLLSFPVYTSSPREGHSGYLIVSPGETPQRFPVKSHLIGSKAAQLPEGCRLSVGHAVAQAFAGQQLNRKTLNSELVAAQTATLGSLIAAKATGTELDKRGEGLLGRVDTWLRVQLRRDYFRIYPGAKPLK